MLIDSNIIIYATQPGCDTSWTTGSSPGGGSEGYGDQTMKSYTFSEARQNFAAILEQARNDGSVRIQRRDGQSFILQPEQKKRSPLDIPGIQPTHSISREDILRSIQEGRRRYESVMFSGKKRPMLDCGVSA